MRRLTSMTYFSIVALNMVDRMSRTISFIYEQCMHTNKLYTNASKYIFNAEEIPFLGCFIGKLDLRADSAKVKAIVD